MTSTASSFFSSETSALERQAEIQIEEAVTLAQIWNANHKQVSLSWIRLNGYKRICLQFPDDYLQLSNEISDSLKASVSEISEAKVFILADTSYGSCCVDEISAAHVDADSVIHFGIACRTKASRLPVLYLYPQLPIDIEEMLRKLSTLQSICCDKQVCVYFDIGYQYLLEQQQNKAGETSLHHALGKLFDAREMHLGAYPPPEDAKIEFETNEETVCIFIGADNNRFTSLSLTSKASVWFIYDAVGNKLCEQNPLTAIYIRRRYYYIEKCKDARTLGLIVATLAADGFLAVVSRLQEMARSRGIKTQIISVGRINPAKLANFMEIDCFVLIGCPFNNMYTSKDYYKPIVSVFEAEMALNPAWHMKYPETYITDFKELLPQGHSFLAFNVDDISASQQDVSLISGRLRNNVAIGENDVAGSSSALIAHDKTSVMTTANGLTFEDRSWQGLDPALGCTEPVKLQKGLSGIPIKYSHD